MKPNYLAPSNASDDCYEVPKYAYNTFANINATNRILQMPHPYYDKRNCYKLAEYPNTVTSAQFHSIRDFITTEKNILKEYYNNYICKGIIHGNLCLDVILVKEDFNVCFLDYGIIVSLNESNLRMELILLLSLLFDLSNRSKEYYESDLSSDKNISAYVDNYLSRRSNNILDLYNFDNVILSLSCSLNFYCAEDCINDYIRRNGYDHLKYLDISYVDISDYITSLSSVIIKFTNLQELYIKNMNLKENFLLVIVNSLTHFKYLFRFEFCTDNNVLSDIVYSIEQLADRFIKFEYLKCIDLRSIFIIYIICK